MENAMLVGYARVSTQDQDLTVQHERLAHCEKLFAETASGTDGKRVQLAACLAYVREGDTLVVTRLDRLARSTLHLYQIADHLAQKGVHLQILDQAIDTRTETGRLLFGMLAVIAQFETELRAERQREGIAKAKRKGVHFGRTKALTPGQVEDLRTLR
jgi:DNA invertase Pin-like site-specific DNA recombinase